MTALKARFEQHLKANLPKAPSFHPHYQDALNAMLSGDAKRFRPLLFLGIVEHFKPLLVPHVLDVALGIELLHTYSLIHDDLPAMDDASLRRSKPTLHTIYDDALAILVGDALNTHAFFCIAQAKLSATVRIELVRLLSEVGGANGMVLGQAIDLHFEQDTLTLDQITTLHYNKTGKLIAGAMQMAGVVVGLDRFACEHLYDLGLKLGLLFQIQDDILDTTRSPKELGKDVLQDADKNSFVGILGLEQAIKNANALLDEIKTFPCDPSFRQWLCTTFEDILHRHQ